MMLQLFFFSTQAKIPKLFLLLKTRIGTSPQSKYMQPFLWHTALHTQIHTEQMDHLLPAVCSCEYTLSRDGPVLSSPLRLKHLSPFSVVPELFVFSPPIFGLRARSC